MPEDWENFRNQMKNQGIGKEKNSRTLVRDIKYCKTFYGYAKRQWLSETQWTTDAGKWVND